MRRVEIFIVLVYNGKSEKDKSEFSEVNKWIQRFLSFRYAERNDVALILRFIKEPAENQTTLISSPSKTFPPLMTLAKTPSLGIMH